MSKHPDHLISGFVQYKRLQYYTTYYISRMFADDIFAATGVRQIVTLSHLAESGAASKKDAIGMWKYGCSRTVSGTTTAFLNDVRMDFNTNWTLEDWSRVIDPLLETEVRYFTERNCLGIFSSFSGGLLTDDAVSKRKTLPKKLLA